MAMQGRRIIYGNKFSVSTPSDYSGYPVRKAPLPPAFRPMVEGPAYGCAAGFLPSYQVCRIRTMVEDPKAGRKLEMPQKLDRLTKIDNLIKKAQKTVLYKVTATLMVPFAIYGVYKMADISFNKQVLRKNQQYLRKRIEKLESQASNRTHEMGGNITGEAPRAKPFE